MIRLAWLQFRAQAAVAFGALAVIAIVAAVSGPHLAHLFDTTVATCTARGDCSTVKSALLKNDRLLQTGLSTLLLVAPALIGIFWGAPLIARELEAGTFRLAWTQSVTRIRWLAVKLGLVGLASMAVAGLFSLIVTWWSSPFDKINLNSFSPGTFGERSVVPIGYAAFALVLGILAGSLIRRTLPAMATTLIVYVAARFAESHWVRPHLRTPLRVSSAFQVPSQASSNAPSSIGHGVVKANDWVLSNQALNGAGRVVGQNGAIGLNGGAGLGVSRDGTITLAGVGRCPNKVSPEILNVTGGLKGPSHAANQTIQAAFQTCIDKLHVRELVIYQPANRFWPFQWYETAIFLAVAGLLAGLCAWWVHRRLT